MSKQVRPSTKQPSGPGRAGPGRIKIIGGKWRGRQLPVITQAFLRPTPSRVRETLFNWLQTDVVNARCLDLFAGSGALGFEALSRGAKDVVFVELAATVVGTLKATMQMLNATPQCQLIQQDALIWLAQERKRGQPFDIIFLDPPFMSSLLAECLALLQDSALVTNKTLIYLEAPTKLTSEQLPTDWQLLKQKKASDVVYQLALGGP